MTTTPTAPTAGDGAAPGAQLGAAQAVQAGTPAEGVQSQPEGSQVTLDALLEAHPHLKQEIESKLVSPHMKRLEQARDKLLKEAEERGAQRAEQARLQAQQSALLDRAAKGDQNAITELGRLQVLNLQAQAGSQQQDEIRRQARYELSRDLVRDVLKIDPDTIPQDVIADPERFNEWAFENSPRTKAKLDALKAELGQLSQNAEVIATANAAANFGVKLQTTPSPNESSGGAPGGARPMTQAEFDANRRNPAWVKANLPRLRAGMDAGLVTR
jgi:hypothetical protein